MSAWPCVPELTLAVAQTDNSNTIILLLPRSSLPLCLLFPALGLYSRSDIFINAQAARSTVRRFAISTPDHAKRREQEKVERDTFLLPQAKLNAITTRTERGMEGGSGNKGQCCRIEVTQERLFRRLRRRVWTWRWSWTVEYQQNDSIQCNMCAILLRSLCFCSRHLCSGFWFLVHASFQYVKADRLFEDFWAGVFPELRTASFPELIFRDECLLQEQSDILRPQNTQEALS